MTRRNGWHLLIPILIVCAVFALMLGGLAIAAGSSAGPAQAETLRRREEPVVVSGDALPGLSNVPIEELALYRFSTTGWEPVPFQIDEVTITGTYVISEDGRLDANDELVFMAKDAAVTATPWEWPDDAQARSAPRHAIAVADPLYGDDEGIVYLYRSSTLTKTTDSYISWDEPAQTLSAISYTLSFQPDVFVGIADLTFPAGSDDVLDRQKLRGQVTVYFGPIPVYTETFDEETIRDFIPVPVTVTLPIVGPVRAVGGETARHFAFYGARADTALALDLSDIVSGSLTISVDYARLSLDLSDPGTSGMGPVYFYDSNGVNVTIDGNPDTVPATPLATWTEVSGATGGWVSNQEISLASGTLSNYYSDDGAFDPNDTGDGRSYGDAGVYVEDPDGLLILEQSLYFLPPGSANMGSTYAAWADNPLDVSVLVEQYVSPPANSVYLPWVTP